MSLVDVCLELGDHDAEIGALLMLLRQSETNYLGTMLLVVYAMVSALAPMDQQL